MCELSPAGHPRVKKSPPPEGEEGGAESETGRALERSMCGGVSPCMGKLYSIR
jgi:hypothetical protein